MVIGPKQSTPKSTPDAASRQIPLPIVIAGGILVVSFFLFMFHTYVMPLVPRRSPAVERVAPPPGYPDVPPYNTKEWQQNAKPGQRMPGVPPVDYSGGASRASGTPR
jgi:hypothetical protein